MIVGAGLGGLVAALGLQRHGVPCRVFERAPSLDEVGAGLSLSPNATRVLIALGLRRQLGRICNSPEALCTKHFDTGEILTLDESVNYEELYGAPYYQVHRADLQALLTETVLGNDAQAIRLNSDFVGFESRGDSVEARFADGSRASGEVLIGCDGVKSLMRDLLWRPGKPHYLGYVAYRGLTPVDGLPEGLIAPSSATFSGPGRHFTRYLIRGRELVNYVAFAQRAEWTDESWFVGAGIDEVLESFAGWAPEVLHIIGNTQEERCHKWGLFGRKPLPRWTRERVTLLGDAAHPMLPFLGQGASIAIEDGFVLARALAECEDAAIALARYEAARLPRANETVEQSAAQGERKHRKPGPGDTIHEFLQTRLFTYDATSVAV